MGGGGGKNPAYKICKTKKNAHYRKSTAACAREETGKRNELQRIIKIPTLWRIMTI
jgi:hypothetical protein